MENNFPEPDLTLDRFVYDVGGLGNGPLNRLHSANIFTMRDLTYASKGDILHIRNCGEVTALKIYAWANSHGVPIADEDLDKRYDFSVKDKVMIRLNSNRYMQKVWGILFERGDIVTIVDDYMKLKFGLNQYTVQTKTGERFWVTPGMIAKI